MPEALEARFDTCFFERNPGAPLWRRATAEALGTCFLIVVAAGSGVSAAHLSPDNAALRLLLSAIGTSGALVALIFTFGKVSGGHFNPLVTALQWMFHQRDLRCTIGYIAAQVIGAAIGAFLVHFAAFDQALNLSNMSARPIIFSHTILIGSEVFSSMALMTVVFGCSRSGLSTAGPVAVGGWLAAAILVSPSGSYANPAITLASIFTPGPFCLPVDVAILFLLAQIFGGAGAFGIVSLLYPLREGLSSVTKELA